MTLNMSCLIDEVFEEELCRAIIAERTEFSLGLLLEEENELVELIPRDLIKSEHCRIEDNYGGEDNLEDNTPGGPLFHLLTPTGKLAGPDGNLRIPLSNRYTLSISQQFFNLIRGFNLRDRPDQLNPLWYQHERVLDELKNYCKEGTPYLIPCFTRPEDVLRPTEVHDPKLFAEDLPSYDEIFLQRAIGAPMVIVRTDYLDKTSNQRYVYARKRPHGLMADVLLFPGRFIGTMPGASFAALAEAVIDIEGKSRSEVGFDYRIYDEHFEER